MKEIWRAKVVVIQNVEFRHAAPLEVKNQPIFCSLQLPLLELDFRLDMTMSKPWASPRALLLQESHDPQENGLEEEDGLCKVEVEVERENQ